MRAKWRLSRTATTCGCATCVTFPGTLHQHTPTVWSQQGAAPTAAVTRGSLCLLDPEWAGCSHSLNGRAHCCPQQERAWLCLLRTRKPALGMGGWTEVSPSTDGCDLEGTQVDGMVSENKTATPWALPTGTLLEKDRAESPVTSGLTITRQEEGDG